MSFPAGFGQITYSVEQMFMFPGKLSAMARAGKKQSEMFRFDKSVLEQSLRNELKKAFSELYFAWRKKEIITESISLIYSFSKIATKQYEVGTGMQADIFRAKAELATLRRDSISIEQNIASINAMINAVFGRTNNQKINPVPWVTVPDFMPDEAALCSLAFDHRAEIGSMNAAIAMATAEAKAAKKNFYPDFIVKGMYMEMIGMGESNLSVMAGITAPFVSYKKFSALYKEKIFATGQVRYELDNMKNMISAQIQDALARFTSSKAQVRIALEHSIPYVDQALQSTVSAYANGNTEFLMLIDAQRMTLMAHMDHHEAIMGVLQSVADLEKAVGMNLPDMIDQLSHKEK
jgi:outer membrane protein TolC